jgi:hypothetical protein
VFPRAFFSFQGGALSKPPFFLDRAQARDDYWNGGLETAAP